MGFVQDVNTLYRATDSHPDSTRFVNQKNRNCQVWHFCSVAAISVLPQFRSVASISVQLLQSLFYCFNFCSVTTTSVLLLQFLFFCFNFFSGFLNSIPLNE